VRMASSGAGAAKWVPWVDGCSAGRFAWSASKTCAFAEPETASQSARGMETKLAVVMRSRYPKGAASRSGLEAILEQEGWAMKKKRKLKCSRRHAKRACPPGEASHE
jgi:hypothetical protein